MPWAGGAARDSAPEAWWWFLAALGLAALPLSVRGVVNWMVFRAAGANLSLGDGWRLSIYQAWGNYLPLSGGLVAKGVLLNRRHGLSYESFAALAIYTFAVELCAYGLAGFPGVLLAISGQTVLLPGVLLLSLAPLVLVLPLDRLPVVSRFQRLANSEEARQAFRPLLPTLIGLHLVMVGLGAVRLMICLSIAGEPLGFFQVILITVCGVLSRFAAVTPGALGIREVFMAAAGYLTGVNYQSVLVAAGLDRLVQMLFVFCTGGILVSRERQSGATRNQSLLKG